MGRNQLNLPTLLFYCYNLLALVKGQQWIADHTFRVGETAVYPPASFVTHHSVPVQLTFHAGATMTMQSATQVQFLRATTIYGANGAENYSEFGGLIRFRAGKTMAVPPGTKFVLHTAESVLRYGPFNGNNVAIVTYSNGARVTFNCPTQPSGFPAGTNVVNFYNPGADNAGVATQFGASAPLVNSVQQIQVTCTGYTQDGFPIRTFRNLLTGEVHNIHQTASSIFNVTLASR